MRGLDGTIEFRILADDVERCVRVQFGTGELGEPRCTIAVRADDARRLQSGELAPQMAFMQGLVKIQGDPGFAMQVAAALFL
jgi:putative sterol carrier protein